MRIVHIASELAPVAKVGGLADVVFGLSRQLLTLGHEVEVILPNYPFLSIPQNVEGIPVRLIEMEGDQMYGCENDAERFIGFCQKAAALIGKYDIVHLHDWHTALCAALLPRSILTIHNLAYEGCFDPSLLKGVDLAPFKDQEQYSLLKGGIHFATQVTTVSPTYAKEIQDHPYIKPFQKKLLGVLNGIDIDYWNPQNDSFLPHHFSINDLSGKKRIQDDLRQRFGLQKNEKPIVGAITRLVPQKSPDLIRAALVKVRELRGQFILLGSALDPTIVTEFEHLKSSYADDPNVHLELTFDEELSHLVFAASDLFIVPSRFEPCGLTQLIAMRYGAVPIVRKTGGLADTVFENKNGFLFKLAEAKPFESTIERAFHLFEKKPEPFHLLQKTGMETDYGWSTVAQVYLTLYKELLL
ncbi:MAG: Glycogen synthase [Chlamydiales bacterium]|nr:Glycogen synthase [Chlamydiales bacterium]MCH9619224.1 Glycogen synthase [Chlamydiales bacterium]MCH9622486.1 Glycogen synthase [Chlamydiales bacterium]